MTAIRLEGVTKRFGEATAVSDLTIALGSGELIALLGPSGCGKTTTLRMIAGFEIPTRGSILLGEMDVTSATPERRNCGMVFQNYALFPHLTVAQNVAFGLEMRRVPRAEIRKRVTEILERVGLGALGGRYPRQISGGQQQRTALARALVINPSALLLDEPLANLDAKLREQMRFYIRSLQREFGITTLYVTHDQAEALVLADRVAILMNGALQQFATPEEVYHRPRSAAVAAFTGLTNLVPARVTAGSGDQYALATAAGPMRAGGVRGLAAGEETLVSVRPEHLEIGRAGMAPMRTGPMGTGPMGAGPMGAGPMGTGPNRLEGMVRERSFLGNVIDFRVAVGGDLILRVQGHVSAPYQTGDAVSLWFEPAAAWVLAREPA